MAAMTAIGMAMPIAAASIVSVGLFGWIWRCDQLQRNGGKAPWYFEISVVLVFLIYGSFGYSLKPSFPSNYLQIFGAAMAAQALAVAFWFGLSNVIWIGRDKPIRQRIIPALATLAIAALILSSAFTG